MEGFFGTDTIEWIEESETRQYIFSSGCFDVDIITPAD